MNSSSIKLVSSLCVVVISICLMLHNNDNNNNNINIIIVGAGIAGLRCAHQLAISKNSSNVYNISILEARNRTYGRVHTRKWNGIVFEQGANWLYTSEHMLINTTDIPLVSTSSDDTPRSIDTILMIGRDERVSDVDLNRCLKEYKNARIRLDDYIDEYLNMSSNVSLFEAFENVLYVNNSNFWNVYPNGKSILDWILSRLLLDCGCSSLSDVNAYWWRHIPDDGSDGEMLVLKGYNKLLEQNIMPSVLNSIQFNEEVVRIDNANRVHTLNGNIYEADHIVVTVPLEILKNELQFRPQLPEAYTDALSRLKIGVLNLIHCVFKHEFWYVKNSTVTFIGNANSSSNFRTFFAVPKFRRNILMIQVPGDFGIHVESVNTDELKTLVYDELKQMFTNASKPLTCMCTRWKNDKYSRGSYSYANIGASAADRHSLQQPIVNNNNNNMLLFAGEHTHDLSSVTGAILSGETAANHILEHYDNDAT